MSSPSTANSAHDGPRRGRFSLGVENPLRGAAEHERELLGSLPPYALRFSQDLRRVPLPKPSESIKLAPAKIGNVSNQSPEATSAGNVVHDTRGYHAIPEGVKADLAEEAIGADPAAAFSVPELGQEEPGLVPVAIVWHDSEHVRAERLRKALEQA